MFLNLYTSRRSRCGGRGLACAWSTSADILVVTVQVQLPLHLITDGMERMLTWKFIVLLLHDVKSVHVNVEQTRWFEKQDAFKVTDGEVWKNSAVQQNIWNSSFNHFPLLLFHFLPPPHSSHRRSPQDRPPLVLDPYVGRALRRGEEQDLPCAGRGDGRVESLVAGAGDDHYLLVLDQLDAPRVQQRLKIRQQVLWCLPRD